MACIDVHLTFDSGLISSLKHDLMARGWFITF